MLMNLIIDGLCWFSLSIFCFATVMVILNAIFATKMGQRMNSCVEKPLVSLLIPMRDEAANLRQLLPALLASTYRPMELLILDDESKDDSSKLASSLVSDAPFPVRVIEGKPWSPTLGLSGKANACAQLAELANGEIFIFCDADIRPSPRAVEYTAGIMTQPGARGKMAGLSALPAQSCSGLRERLLMPWIMHIPLMISLPLFCSWRLPADSMQMANGQWLALFKSDYVASGGHRDLGTTPLEDVALARHVHRITGRGLQPVLAAGDISAAMYRDWQSTLAGFSKNLVAIGGGTPLIFATLMVIINVVFLFPIWGYFFRPDLAAICLGLFAVIRVVTARTFKMPVRDLLLHPFSLVLLDIAAWKSLRTSLRGNYEWKGRVVKWSST
jgi:hypothetical protein